MDKQAKRALSSEDGKTWEQGGWDAEGRTLKRECGEKWPMSEGFRASVVKLVVGKLDQKGDENEKREWTEVGEALGNLKEVFPEMTHLYVWGINEVEVIGGLPVGLKVLDVRHCPNLKEVSIPSPCFEELVIWQDDSKLEVIEDNEGEPFPELFDLSLKGLSDLPEKWIHSLVERSPLLRLVVLERIQQLKRLRKFPPLIEVLSCNECENLKLLPSNCPPQVRRLELADTKLAFLPKLPESCDYLNFCGMRELQSLPAGWEGARSLFLYRSGILEPPASEHGANREENVAGEIRDYFEERDRFGTGQVKRCKVIMLGDGSAGKTSLSLALTGRDPYEAKKLGSTHGIQLWDTRMDCPIICQEGEFTEEVNVDFWDFGGQDFYHDAHRLFMERGAVFVVMWYPERPPMTRAERKRQGPEDELKPLKYWLDLIRLVCPHKPRVAIVRSHAVSRNGEMMSALEKEVGSEHLEACDFFTVDSVPEGKKCAPLGDFEEVQEWVENAVGEVVGTQGSRVPSYWQDAEQLVHDWTQQMVAAKESQEKGSSNELRSLRQMSPEEFRRHLDEKIAGSLLEDAERKRLYLKNHFELNDKRVARILRFLTRVGAAFWIENSKEQRLVVGQEWALGGIYSFLKREDAVYGKLVATLGRFSEDDFQNWILDKGEFRDDEAKVLLKTMVQLGLLIPLTDPERDWYSRVSEYVSVRHLTEVDHETWTRYCCDPDALDEQFRSIESPHFHRANWSVLLSKLGAEFGIQGKYFKNAFLLDRVDDSDLSIRVKYATGGLGATLTINLRGAQNEDEMSKVLTMIEEHFPENEGKVGEKLDLGDPAPMEVFVSYAWNDQSKGIDYETPVNAVCQMLQEIGGLIVHRDKDSTREGDDLRKFMEEAARNCDLFLLFQSDKYWRSTNCVFELHSFDQSLGDRQDLLKQVIMSIEHIPNHPEIDPVFRECGLSKGREGARPVKILKDFWKNTPPAVNEKYASTSFFREPVARAIVLIDDYIEKLDKQLEGNLKWSYGEAEVLLGVKKRVLKRLEETKEKRSKKELRRGH